MKKEESKLFYRKRLAISIIGLISWFFLILLRLIDLQIIRSDEYAKMAKRQQFWKLELNPKRGNIYDRTGRALAISIDTKSLYIIPKEIKDPKRTSIILSKYLNISADEILKKINQDESFIWLKRKMDIETADIIDSLKLPGVGFLKESSRYYPAKKLASQIIGFVGMDHIGLEGAELYYDKYLKGNPLKIIILRDASNHQVMINKISSGEENKGSDLFLTIHYDLQYAAEEELEAWVNKFEAKKGTIIVMDVQTGEIYALANYPNYDPNRFYEYPAEYRTNVGTQFTFEPGSIFKVIIAAAALEEKKIKPEDIFDCQQGKIILAGFTIRDHESFGLLNFEQIIEKSSNVGMIKVGLTLGPQIVYRYIKKFGIGEKTGIDLNGEAKGYIRPIKDWSAISIGALSIGQEVFTTPIRMLLVIAAIANGGYLVKPYIGYKLTNSENTIRILNSSNKEKEKILNEETVDILRGFLRGVVLHGTGKLAEVKGYGASGKTGTAQKIGPSHTYIDGGVIASFMGYLPAAKPKVAIIVVIDEPKKAFWGSQVAAPLFSRIGRKTMEYLRIPYTDALYAYKSTSEENNQFSFQEIKFTQEEIEKKDDLPNLIGYSASEAIEILTKLKLPFRIIGTGNVIDQEPEPGFPLSLTKGVIIYLNKEAKKN